MIQASSSQAALASVRIVLVSPAGPLNVGSIARVMKNFGLSQLVLVAPQCDPTGEEAMQMAVHAKDVLRAARRVETVPAALSGCRRAIATTARQRGFEAPLDLPEVALPALLPWPSTDAKSAGSADADAASHTALIFGPEDRGLSNEELIHAQQFVKVPTDPGYSALNLAQAVAICCYELYRASQFSPARAALPSSSSQFSASDLSVRSVPDVPISEQNLPIALRNSPLSGKQTESAIRNEAKLDELEGYYQHLETVLLSVGYLYPHTAASRMRKFRQLLHRAAPTSQEVALLRGILRQVEWALSESQKG